MKIVAISDTHMKHNSIVIPDGDVLVHTGDSTKRGSLQELTSVNEWFGTLPHKHKILISGNHDFGFQDQPQEARGLMTNVIYLQDEEVTIDGIKFYGSPWQPWFCNWAFNLRRGHALKVVWDEIPEDTDVLLTHSPPHGIMDLVDCDSINKGEHVGCEELTTRLNHMKTPPKLHVFGHIHEGYGVQIIGKTKYVNAAICDVMYRAVNASRVIEI